MKYIKTYESVRDFLQPKSNEDILKGLSKLSDTNKLMKACEYNLVWLVKELLDKGVTPLNLWYCFFLPVDKNYTEVVDLILKSGKVDPSINNNNAIINACTNNHFKMFKILYDYQYDDIPKFGDNLLYICLVHKSLRIFKFLLKDKRINLSEDTENLVSQSLEKSTKRFAELLLNDERVINNLKKDSLKFFRLQLKSYLK